MANSCPVVLPHFSSFPEVAGDAGIYFDLNNEKELESKLLEVLENVNLRNEYIAKGLIQSEKFTWKKTAEECYDIFQKAVTSEY